MTNKPAPALHIALWIVQVLLALAFFMAGAMKLSQPIDALLANGMTFVAYSPAWLVRFIGLAELLGAIGLLAPSVLKILPPLSALAAAGLALIMALAFGVHLTHGEAPAVVPNLVLGGLAAFVAWGRFVGAPIAARG